MACYFVDTTDALICLLGEIQQLPNSPPSFYIDAEGYKLGRHGTLDLIQIHVLPLKRDLHHRHLHVEARSIRYSLPRLFAQEAL